MLIVEDSFYPNCADFVIAAAQSAPDELLDASAACDGLAAMCDAELRQN